MKFLFISTMEGTHWGASELLWSQTALRLAAAGHTVSAAPLRSEAAVWKDNVCKLEAGGAPEDMRLCGDWLAWIRMLQHGVAFIAAPLNRFRWYPMSVRSSTSTIQFCAETYRVARFIGEHHSIAAAVRGRAHERAWEAGRWTVRYSHLPPSWPWVWATGRLHARLYERSATAHLARCLWWRSLRTMAADWLRASKHRVLAMARNFRRRSASLDKAEKTT